MKLHVGFACLYAHELDYCVADLSVLFQVYITKSITRIHIPSAPLYPCFFPLFVSLSFGLVWCVFFCALSNVLIWDLMLFWKIKTATDYPIYFLFIYINLLCFSSYMCIYEPPNIRKIFQLL